MTLASCGSEPEVASPEGRPVRTVVVEKREAGAPIVLTGRIEAEDEVTLAFRISGRLLESNLRLGDQLKAGQLVARLEPQNELNALRTAQANLAAAQGQLTQARNHFERQDTLLRDGWTTRANHDQATQALKTAQSQVEAAEAELKIAHDLVSFTELKADAPGVVTATGPRAGEVVQIGQMIVKVARQGGRDAVFDVLGPSDALGAGRPRSDGDLDGRPVRDGARTRTRGGAAGRSCHPDVRGQGRSDRPTGRHAARRNRDRARAARGRSQRSRSRRRR